MSRLIYIAGNFRPRTHLSSDFIMSPEYLWSNFTGRSHSYLLGCSRVSLWKAADFDNLFYSLCTLILVYGFSLLLPYLFTAFLTGGDEKDQSLDSIPPSYPNRIPVFGHAVAFALDMPGVITRFAYKSPRPYHDSAF